MSFEVVPFLSLKGLRGFPTRTTPLSVSLVVRVRTVRPLPFLQRYVLSRGANGQIPQLCHFEVEDTQVE